MTLVVTHSEVCGWRTKCIYLYFVWKKDGEKITYILNDCYLSAGSLFFTYNPVFLNGNTKYNILIFNPLPDMPILGSSNSAANANTMSKIWTNGVQLSD